MDAGNLFWRLFLINFLITLGFGIADAFFSMYLFSLGARGTLLALPLMLYSLAKVFLGPIVGRWTDRFGEAEGVVMSLILYLLVSVGYFLTDNLVSITVLRILQGVSCAMFRPIVFGLVGRCCSHLRRSTVMGTFDISFYGALSLGPLVGGMLKDHLGYRGVFAAIVAVCLIALVVIIDGSPSKLGLTVKTETAQAEGGDFRRLICHRGLQGLLAFIFGRACGISLSAAFLPIVLSTQLGLTGTQTGLVMAASTFMVAVVLRPAGLLADKVPRKTLVVVGGTVVPLLYLLIPMMPGFSQVLMLVLGIGFFSALSQPASSALLLEEGNRFGMGSTVGTFNSVLNLGFISGPLLGVGIQQSCGLPAVFTVAGGLGLVTMALFVVTMTAESWRPEFLRERE